MTTVSSISNTHSPATPHVSQFEILEEIGRGGKAKVYKAKDANGRIIALKCFFDKTKIEGVSFEFEIGQQLNHPHIIKIFDSFVNEHGRHVLVLEFVNGLRLRNCENIEPKVILQLLDTLIYIHDQGFIHGDLRSDNFMIEEGNLKMVDLGSLIPIGHVYSTLKRYGRKIAHIARIDPSHFDRMPNNRITKENLKDLQKLLIEIRHKLKIEFQQVVCKMPHGL